MRGRKRRANRAGGSDPRRVIGPRASQLLRLAVAASHEPTVTIAEIVRGLRKRAFGFVLLAVALVNCVPLPPVVSTLAGIPVFLVGVQLLLGWRNPWLPAFIRRRKFNRRHVAETLERAEPYLRWIERLSRPRWPLAVWFMTPRLVGSVVVLLALYIMAPLVFTNIPPAMAAVILAIALIEEDGLMLIVGVFAAAVALTVSSLLAAGTIAVVLYGAGSLIGLF